MKFTVKNWTIFYDRGANDGEFAVKRYDMPFEIKGNVENDVIWTEKPVPKYLLIAIKRYFPFRAWQIRINETEIMLTSPEKKSYNINYDIKTNYLFIDYPNEIPRTLREYLQTKMYYTFKENE